MYALKGGRLVPHMCNLVSKFNLREQQARTLSRTFRTIFVTDKLKIEAPICLAFAHHSSAKKEEGILKVRL